MTDDGTSPNFWKANFLDLWKVLTAARKAVPAVDWALGLAGIAAAVGIIRLFIGDGQAAAVSIAVMLLGMVVLYLVSRITRVTTRRPSLQEQVLLWAVTIFVCCILVLSLTALTFEWPGPIARLYGLAEAKDGAEENTMPVTHDGSLDVLGLQMSDSVAGTEFTLEMEDNPNLKRFWVEGIEDENYQEFFKKLCRKYTCLSCEPLADQITDRVFLSAKEELEAFTNEAGGGKATYYRCKQ